MMKRIEKIYLYVKEKTEKMSASELSMGLGSQRLSCQRHWIFSEQMPVRT